MRFTRQTSSHPSGNPLRVFRAGWTIVEMMVALSCGTIILAAFVATTVMVSNTMVSVGNYNDLNKMSRQTLDWFSRDVRNASSVSDASTSTMLILTNSYSGTKIIQYVWDGSNVLSRTESTSTTTNTTSMLTNCEVFSMSFYQRNPTNNFSFVTSAIPAQIKLISVSWRCSRTVLGSKLNTESVQTANVVMRN